MAGLLAVQNFVQEKGRLLAPCSTRWLSTERSVTRLKGCLCLSFCVCREKRNRCKGCGAKPSYNYYCTIPRMLPSTLHSLEQLQTVDGCNLEPYPAELADAGIELIKRHNLGEVYFRGSFQKPYLRHIIKKLHDRLRTSLPYSL